MTTTRWKVVRTETGQGRVPKWRVEGTYQDGIPFSFMLTHEETAAQIVREHNSISKLRAFAQMIANGGLDSGVDHATIEAEAREALNA